MASSSRRLRVLGLVRRVPVLSGRAMTDAEFLELGFPVVELVVPALVVPVSVDGLFPPPPGESHGSRLAAAARALEELVARRVGDRRAEVSRLDVEARAKREGAYRRAFMSVAAAALVQWEQPDLDREAVREAAAAVAGKVMGSRAAMHHFVERIVLARNPKLADELDDGGEAGASRVVADPGSELEMIKVEYAELKRLHEQLVDEARDEPLDRRRVAFLKAQVIQLERQVVELSRGMESHELAYTSLAGAVASVATTLDGVLEGTTGEPDMAEVRLPLGTVRAMRSALGTKGAGQIEPVRAAHVPLRTLNPFIKPWQRPPFTTTAPSEAEEARSAAAGSELVVNSGVSLVAVAEGVSAMAEASGDAPLHVGQLAQLEAQVAALHTSVLEARNHLGTVLPMVALPSTESRVLDAVARLEQQLGEVSHSLLSLGMIVPMTLEVHTAVSRDKPAFAAPERVERPTTREVLDALPPFARDKRAGARTVAAVLAGARYSEEMMRAEVRTLRALLGYYGAAHHVRTEHVLNVIVGAEEAAAAAGVSIGRGRADRLLDDLEALQTEAYANYEALLAEAAAAEAAATDARLPDLWEALRAGELPARAEMEASMLVTPLGGGRRLGGRSDNDESDTDSLIFSPLTPVRQLLDEVLEEERAPGRASRVRHGSVQ
ncbi:uncharacterized protein AMSG_05654 [Thecamonas trahens ATCC 50062]|uniref:Uncharacterized protein n=1 Tax=Thecamonas trahens ATCC 50062 TaxID=461836 RepID=A0A0L0DE72_THETB|nr:hypothetical protein AMSG_05654 [Thecamonas trahens ATCC 50062]KNC49613.1 hypothetical protein AMSG_05654 [Thecamonas trahens ATCC 50062]|eukprot:XP_013757720.1 hypothetical protein AMSG_05654 [Thecamonas trahens ATCC 50062]